MTDLLHDDAVPSHAPAVRTTDLRVPTRSGSGPTRTYAAGLRPGRLLILVDGVDHDCRVLATTRDALVVSLAAGSPEDVLDGVAWVVEHRARLGCPEGPVLTDDAQVRAALDQLGL